MRAWIVSAGGDRCSMAAGRMPLHLLALALSCCAMSACSEEVRLDEQAIEAIGLRCVSVDVGGDGQVKLVVYRRGRPLEMPYLGDNLKGQRIRLFIQGESPFDPEPRRISVVYGNASFYSPYERFPDGIDDGWEWQVVDPAIPFNGMHIMYAMVNPDVPLVDMNWAQSPSYIALKW